MATITPKVFSFESQVTWEKEKRGRLSAPGKPEIDWATPPEFQGHPGVWTPEDFFVAALNACFLSTFITLSQRARLSWVAYESRATGVVTIEEGEMKFTQVTLRPRVTLAHPAEVDKAREVLENVEDYCPVANSVKCTVLLEPEIVA